MYLRKIEGPRAVTLPDGSIMTRADLPLPTTRRWVASRKAIVVRAVAHGLLSEQQALEIYNLSREELAEWARAISAYGLDGLKVTSIQKYRQP